MPSRLTSAQPRAERVSTTEAVARYVRRASDRSPGGGGAPVRARRPAGRESSLTAAAARVGGARISRTVAAPSAWQGDAWDMYDLVGEQRFLASTLAGRLSQARLYVAVDGQSLADDSTAVEDAGIEAVLDSIGDGTAGRSQLLHRLAVNLFVAGEAWLVGIPPELLPEERGGARPAGPASADVRAPGYGEGLGDAPLDSLQWRALSVSEVSSEAGDLLLSLGDADEERVRCQPEDVYLIRVWRPHPRRWREADSPTRACLPILRELVGLTMHISAQIDSRLAGAGLLVVPQSASDAVRRSAGTDEADEADPFVEALMEAMTEPIADRDAASAVVPLVVTVPDEVADSFNHITFSTSLDDAAKDMRDEAIRRLALAQDAPPELLLGTGGMNHWGAWLVREDVVTTHIEPPLALICEALTSQFLWPVLESMGYSEAGARRFSVAYDVSHLVARPNRSDEALALHAAGALSDATLREAAGFDESDAPEGPAATGPRAAAIKMATSMVTKNAALLTDPGLPALVDSLEAVLAPGAAPDLDAGTPLGAPAPPSGGVGADGSAPAGA